MQHDPEKESLRKVLLEKRDNTSSDLAEISSKQILKNLKKISEFRNAKKIACYSPIGSEVRTQDLMQEILSQGKDLFLPKVEGGNLSFRKISSFKDVEKGKFDIMEPKEDCPKAEEIQVILVPTVGISRQGYRLGYGYGFYDRFLGANKIPSISLVYAKQIVKSIPHSEHDAKIDWIVSEDEFIKTS